MRKLFVGLFGLFCLIILDAGEVKATNIDEFVKSLILLAPQAILGFMIRLAKLQELGLTPSNSLQFLTPGSS